MNAHHRSQLQGLFFSLSLVFNSAHKIATCVFPSIFHIEQFKAEETSRTLLNNQIVYTAALNIFTVSIYVASY